MPYAIENQISMDVIPGGIEITEAQYQAALAGMLEGKVVSIDGGFNVTFPPEPEPEPVPEPTSEPRTIFGVREFRQRFTHEEQVAIRAASFSDMDVGLIYDEFLSAQYIDVADPATAAGIDLYINKGLLNATRRDELLAPFPDEEIIA
ncbi:hypothetical protein ACXIUT_29820 [Achromobacter denitrificans]